MDFPKTEELFDLRHTLAADILTLMNAVATI